MRSATAYLEYAVLGLPSDFLHRLRAPSGGGGISQLNAAFFGIGMTAHFAQRNAENWHK